MTSENASTTSLFTSPAFWAFATVATIVAGVVLYAVPPERVTQWQPFLVLIPGIIVIVQQAFNSHKLEVVRADVNSKTDKALATTSTEAYARGSLDTMAQLRELIQTAVAEERAKGMAAMISATTPPPSGTPVTAVVVDDPAKKPPAPPRRRTPPAKK